MKIGVVSDTHNNLRNVGRIVEMFNTLGVGQVVHTGDITQPKTLQALSHLEAPLAGVFGNNDQERPILDHTCADLGFHFVEPPLRFEVAGRSIVVVHDPLELEPLDIADESLILHGHTHRTTQEWQQGGILTFNPGECAGMMTGHNTIGVVDLGNLDVELLKF